MEGHCDIAVREREGKLPGAPKKVLVPVVPTPAPPPPIRPRGGVVVVEEEEEEEDVVRAVSKKEEDERENGTHCKCARRVATISSTAVAMVVSMRPCASDTCFPLEWWGGGGDDEVPSGVSASFPATDDNPKEEEEEKRDTMCCTPSRILEGSRKLEKGKRGPITFHQRNTCSTSDGHLATASRCSINSNNSAKPPPIPAAMRSTPRGIACVRTSKVRIPVVHTPG